MKATVKQIPIRQRVSRWNLIRFQILIWCSLRYIQITDADIDMLVLLSLLGKSKLTSFCEELVKTNLSTGVRTRRKESQKEIEYIFNSLQSARNAVSKVTALGLIIKEGKNKSNIHIQINPNMDIHTDNNLLINYQLLCIDSTES